MWYLYTFSLILPVELPGLLEASYPLITSQDILVMNSVLLTTVQGQQAVEGNTGGSSEVYFAWGKRRGKKDDNYCAKEGNVMSAQIHSCWTYVGLFENKSTLLNEQHLPFWGKHRANISRQWRPFTYLAGWHNKVAHATTFDVNNTSKRQLTVSLKLFTRKTVNVLGIRHQCQLQTYSLIQTLAPHAGGQPINPFIPMNCNCCAAKTPSLSQLYPLLRNACPNLWDLAMGNKPIAAALCYIMIPSLKR